MEEVFADAYYWIALANPSDQGHNAAKRFDAENPQTLIITTDEVLTEFLNFYAEAGSHRRRLVGAMCEQVLLHPNIFVIPASRETFMQGLNLYRHRDDKGFSLTDCISMIVCQSRSIRHVLTNDRHFEQEGLIRLF